MMISIVIVTWNAARFMEGCLKSIKHQSYKDWELIIVDNCSTDTTLDIVQRQYSKARILENSENLGFCKANNQGISIAQGDFIFTLNSDIILDKDFIKELVLASENKTETIGMFGGKMLRMDAKTIDSTGLILSKSRRFYDRGGGEVDRGQYDETSEVFGICAGAAFYRREMLEEIKADGQYFDNDFFFLGEDFDIAWRAQLCGWKALYVPNARCLHLRGSSEHKSKFKQYLSFKNRYLLMIKNDSLSHILLALLRLLAYDIARFFYLLFTNKLLFKGIRDVIQLFPTMLQRRKITIAHRKVSKQYMRQWLQ